MKKKKKLPYTTGTLNKAVDLALHPLIRKHGAPVIVVDGVLHALIERNPKVSFIKFLKYNLSPLIKELTKKYK